eukprot:UN03283
MFLYCFLCMGQTGLGMVGMEILGTLYIIHNATYRHDFELILRNYEQLKPEKFHIFSNHSKSLFTYTTNATNPVTPTKYAGVFVV